MNIESLFGSKTNYMIALKSDSSHVKADMLMDYSRENAKQKFVNEHEAIFAYETEIDFKTKGGVEAKDRICIYFNQTIAGVEMTEYLDKMNKGWEGYTDENFQKAKERFGIYVIQTNIRGMNLQAIYEYYKSRFEIEYKFDTLKNTLDFDKVYMHSDASLESWMFINHISITITQRIYSLLTSNKINLSLHSFFKKMRQVIKQRSIFDKDKTYTLQVIPKKIKLITEKLNIS